VSIRLARSGVRWLSVALSASVLIAGAAVIAEATVTHKFHPRNGGNGPVICRPDGRRTVESHGVYYIVRNDVYATPERECIRLQKHGAGFVVTRSGADTDLGNNDAFPEVIYGCEWGACSKHTLLPKRVYRLKHVVTSWGASWRHAAGHFDVTYDIWFGHLHEVHGQVRAAEIMIWLGTKGFGTPRHDRIYRIDGVRWYYARHYACDMFGCWNYVLFRRVVPSTHADHLGLLPFVHVAERQHQLAWWWFLKSIEVGFEIWRGGNGLAVHSYSVRVKLHRLPHRHARR
jgi:hypothetical protein